MENFEQKGYLAPEIDVIEIQVEQGFALSNPMPEIGGENEEIGW